VKSATALATLRANRRRQIAVDSVEELVEADIP
jgi:hypothetical protein